MPTTAPLTATTPSKKPPLGKILVAVTEDWFALSHFQPLIRTLVSLAQDVVVATNSSGRMAEIAALGARPLQFDYRRASRDPVDQLRIVAQLRQLIANENPDVVHAISLKPMALAGLAYRSTRGAHKRRLVLHLTGVGYHGDNPSWKTRAVHGGSLNVVRQLLRRPDVSLFAENPDDAGLLFPDQPLPVQKVTILGGAGIDPASYPPSPLPMLTNFTVGFVGRIIWQKGVDTLVDAHRLLRRRGLAVDLALAGEPDTETTAAVSAVTLAGWAAEPGIRHVGRISDIAGFWAGCHVAVVPSRGREGMPRVALEAAACGRPLIVSDIPGCRHFVRHEIDGLIVPVDNATGLADAIERLIRDPALAQQFGLAARGRVLSGFTERHVQAAVAEAYGRF
jgi:glycosyltransferase involved in cell wall biosynthesis